MIIMKNNNRSYIYIKKYTIRIERNNFQKIRISRYNDYATLIILYSLNEAIQRSRYIF